MQRLSMEIKDRRTWFDVYTSDNNRTVIFCSTASPPPAGSSVVLDISFHQGPRLFVRGTVIWRRSRPSTDPRMRPGAGISLPESEKPKGQFISGYARGGLLDQRQGGRRLPVRLQTTYSPTDGRRRMNFTRDVSENGICLSCAELLDKRSPINLEVLFPKKIGVYKMQGWVVRHIEDDKGLAMAVNLTFPAPEDRFGFAGALRRLEDFLMAGELAEQHLH